MASDEQAARAFDDARKEAFFAALAECLNVAQAAARAGTTPQNIWLHRRKDPAFARRWLEAMDQAYVEMELMLLRAVRDGGVADVTTVTPLPGDGGDAAEAAAAARRTTRHSPRMMMGMAQRLMQLRQANMIALTLLREAEERGGAGPAPDIEELKQRARALLSVIRTARAEASAPAPAADTPAAPGTTTGKEDAGDGRRTPRRR